MLTRKPRHPMLRYLREAYFLIANPVKRMSRVLARPKTRGSKMLVRRDGKILLVRIGYGPKFWTLPGGMVDRGETFKQSALRETFEETGVVLTDAVFIGGFSRMEQGKDDTVECFTAEADMEDLVIDDQEIVDAGWFSPDALPEPRGAVVEQILRMYDTYTRTP